MKNILSQSNRSVLQEFLWSKVLVALDYDGTLAPIVAKPERAKLRARTRDLLRQVTALYPVVVISGRAQADVLERVREAGVRAVVGNHGMEPWHALGHYVAEVASWAPRLEAALGRQQGVVIEDKAYSIAVHYRHSREKKKARAAILAASKELGEVRIVGGKQVINILPQGAPHKGFALERARARLQCDTAIYVGDDETDEDVFALDQPGRLLSIRVGKDRKSAAGYYLENQLAIDELLAALVNGRLGVSPRAESERPQ